MNLIIKPTEACNFSCSFCSSSYLVDNKKAKLHLQYIYDFLKRYPETTCIFVVGGDPLMMPVQYYKDMIKHIKENGYKTTISFTTNLWKFYKNPEEWLEIFSEDIVEVSTSFQYGNGRQIKPGEIFTEEIFMDVYKHFKSFFPNKELTFLAVIDEHNESKAIDHVFLAKKLNTQCRLVYQNKSGKGTTTYPVGKLYKIFVQIWRMGLAQYEQTAIAIAEKLNNMNVGCPIARNCDSFMRSLNPDGRYFSCGPLNDDLDVENEIDFKKEMEGEQALPLQKSKHQFLKPECFGCKMFDLCNGCRKHIKDLKETNKVEENCIAMKAIEKDLLEMSNSTDLKDLFDKQGVQV
jgi:radical SAM protein with 4Fe4S-binding SPASM domain